MIKWEIRCVVHMWIQDRCRKGGPRDSRKRRRGVWCYKEPRSILHHGMKLGGTGGVDRRARGTPISFRNVNEPAATSNERSTLPFFSLPLSPPSTTRLFTFPSRGPFWFPPATLEFFPNNGGHPAVACNTEAARRRWEWCTTYPDND